MAALSSSHYCSHKCTASGELALSSLHSFSSSSRLLKYRSPLYLKLTASFVVMEKTFETAKYSQTKETLDFVKYQGLGNDFLLVDNRNSLEPKISPQQAVKLCNRNFGVGADGVIFAMPGIDGSDYSMRIFNSDGSEPEMCGNGIRCLARFVAELENTTKMRRYCQLFTKNCFYSWNVWAYNIEIMHSYTIHILAGHIIPKLRDDGQVIIHTLAGHIIPKLRDDGQVEVDMGRPTLNAADVPTKLVASENGAVVKVPLQVEGQNWLATCVSMGNPHCVIFSKEDGKGLEVNSLPLERIGPLFEHHEVFPARTNTEFIQVLSPSHVRMRVWERGAGATLACGTGACAVVVAGVLEGRIDKKCTVDLPGGPLEIEWRENNHVYMTGPAELVCQGKAFL